VIHCEQHGENREECSRNLTGHEGGTTVRRILTLAVVAVLLLGVAGFSADRKTIRVAMDVDAGKLDPRLARDTTAYRACNLIYDALVQLDANFQPHPSLATSWETEDSLTWVFHLRTDVTFSDGTPLTAEDVAFTYQTLIDPNFGAPYRSLYTPIQTIEVVDAQTVKMVLSNAYAPLFSYLDHAIVPKHIAATNPDQLISNPIGSGPFTLARWDKGSKLVLEARDDYWGGASNLNIEIVIVPDATARAQALEAGDLDLIMSPLAPQDVSRLDRDPSITGVVMAGVGVTYLNFNCTDPILSDVRVRQAIGMLVDQATISGYIYEGMDLPATSILLPSWSAYTDAIRQPQFGVDAAKARLAEAGWKDTNSDGILDKNGEKLSIVLSTHTEDANRVQTVEYLQYLFSEVGIDATTSVADWASFSANVYASKHQLALLGWLNLIDPDRATYNQLYSTGANNWGKYANPQLDVALDAGRSGLTEAARTQAYRTAATIIASDMPYYIVLYQGYQVFYTPKLVGFEPNARGFLRTLMSCTLED